MIQVKLSSFKAALSLAPNKDVRYYINGVRILVRENGHIHVMSTDGHCAFDDRMEDTCPHGQFDFVVPIETCKAIVKLAHKAQIKLEFSKIADDKFECGSLTFTPVGGKYPDIDRVIPKRDNSLGNTAQYNWELLAKCQSAMRIAIEKRTAFFKMQDGQHTANSAFSTGLMCRENADYPRIAIVSLNMAKAFLGN